MTARKPLLALAGFLALGALVACSDSSGSSSGGGNGSSASSKMTRSVKIDEDSVRFVAEMTAKVLAHDEAARVLYLAIPNEKRCLVDGGTTSWETVQDYPDSSEYVYSFGAVPDAIRPDLERAGFDLAGKIALFIVDEDETNVFLGADSSSVFGKWTSTPCTISAREGIDCDEITSGVLTVGKGSVKEKVTLSLPRNELLPDDPFATYFMSNLYDDLSGVSSPYFYPLEPSYMFFADSEIVAESIEDGGIEIQSQTKKSQTFSIDGKSYTVNVLKRSYDVESTGNGFDLSVDVEVVGETGTCRITARSISAVGAEYCADKYMDNYELDTDEDYDENEYTYAESISWSNADEHEDCLKRLAGAASPAPAVAKAVRWTAAAKKSDAAKKAGVAKKPSVRRIKGLLIR